MKKIVRGLLKGRGGFKNLEVESREVEGVAEKIILDYFERANKGNFSKIKIDERVAKARDREGVSLLHIAAEYGENEVIVELFENGADINCEDLDGYRPLRYAAILRDDNAVKTFKTLIDLGAEL